MSGTASVANTFQSAVTATGLQLDNNFATIVAYINDPTNRNNYAADSGNTATFAIALSPAPGGYTAGLEITFKAANANAAAAQVNVNSLGAKNIVDQNGQSLILNAMPAGSIVKAVYDGTRFVAISAPYVWQGGVVTTVTATVGALVNTGLTDISAAGAGQVRFPAAQNASANANTLDDYEEGTWTPSLSDGTTAPVTGTGRYTKIGRYVFLSVDLYNKDISTHTVTTTFLRITGLPFSPASDFFGVLAITGTATLDVSKAIATSGNTRLELYKGASGPDFVNLTKDDFASAGTSSVRGQFSFETL